jgi:hypothetical protein
VGWCGGRLRRVSLLYPGGGGHARLYNIGCWGPGTRDQGPGTQGCCRNGLAWVHHPTNLVILSEAKNLVPRLPSCLIALRTSIYARDEILRFAQNDKGKRVRSSRQHADFASPSRKSGDVCDISGIVRAIKPYKCPLIPDP